MNVKIKCDKKTLVKQIKTTDDVIEKTLLKRFLAIKNQEIKEKEIRILKQKEMENAIKLREIHNIKDEEEEKEKAKIKWNDFDDTNTNNKLTNRLDDEIDFILQKKEKKIETAFDNDENIL
jgi:hypothetical protein|uniref:Uncharacterized protein n=1 Tax=viral metagenome TaxID=1070528 RepID=A0A6C0E0L7_9ZZZZ